MTDTIGRGVIELSTDGQKLRAGIDDAKKSLNELGITAQTATKSSSASIDRYVRSLGVAAVATAKTTRETELMKLGLRGATDAQLKAADAALRMSEAHDKSAVMVDRLKGGMIALAVAAAGAAVGFGSGLIDQLNYLDHLNDLHKTTGVAVGDLAGLGLAAKQSGTDLDGVADAVGKLSKNIGKDPEKYKALGITAKEPLEAFKQLADIFVKIEDLELRAAVADTALGKSWKSTAPLLAEGGQRIGEMVEKGKLLAGVTSELTEGADKFNDSLAELKATSAGFSIKLVGDMLPALNNIIAAINKAYQESGKLAALWAAMKGGASWLFTDEFASAKVKNQAIDREIADLEIKNKNLSNSRGQGALQRSMFGTLAGNNQRIAELVLQRQALQDAADAVDKNKPDTKPDPALAARGRKFVQEPKTGAAPRDTTEQDNKAQLALDLDLIRKYHESQVNLYANAEKTISALRDAGRVDEKDYFDYRREILLATSREQEDELEKQIARMQRETFEGDNRTKNELENAKKIADAEAQLAKVRENTGAALNVLAITEDVAAKKRVQHFRDAEDAANEYLDALKRGNLISLAGQGAGNQERERMAARAQIVDKYAADLRALEKSKRDSEFAGTFGGDAQDKYNDELDRIKRFQALALAEYDRYYAARLKGESDWSTGAMEAVRNYQSEARNVAKQTEDLFTNAFKGMEDALVNFVKTGKLDFKSLADSIISDLIRMQIKASATKLLDAVGGGSGLLSSLVDGIFGGGQPEQLGGPGFTPRAGGGPVAAGQPYLVGEDGPEFFVPDQSGNIVPNGAMGGAVNVNIPINITAPGADPAALARLEGVVRRLPGEIVPKVVNAVRRGGSARQFIRG